MALAPLSHELFPNIRPIVFPAGPQSFLPVGPQLFSAVHSLALPALLPVTEIPPILRNFHRTLRPQGRLHLVLIDPAPVRENLGPKMQKWLDDNLLLDLQRNFRCTSPSQLFPSWLAEAQLRGAGSLLSIVKFMAVHSAPQKENSSGVANSGAHCGGSCGSSSPTKSPTKTSDREAKMELRSVVGRMLWAEVWGQFVAADKWWWDDAECVEECRRLGTFWEYRIIEAVKEG